MNTSSRVTFPLSIYDRVLEFAGLAIVFANWILIAVTYSKLPETVPVHFDAAGEANGFGTKNIILMLPAIATGIFLLMTALIRFPHIMNYPVRITDENAFVQYRLMTRMSRCIAFTIALFFGYIELQSIRVALGRVERFGAIGSIIMTALIFIPVIYYRVKAYRNK
ncbi:MAG: DUF1648 domain-containing protein [Cytophagaceae bacterium]|jgi:uncharacterized membrane protein|nr:DUF1648 domain-containing protein [Cytophagaceae bacterium]